MINILIIYLLILLLFKFISNNYLRFLLLLLISIYCIWFFKLKKKKLILIILLTFSAVITEIIFIKYFKNTWKYYNNDIVNVPYWLFPLWFICIVFILEIYKIFIKLN